MIGAGIGTLRWGWGWIGDWGGNARGAESSSAGRGPLVRGEGRDTALTRVGLVVELTGGSRSL